MRGQTISRPNGGSMLVEQTLVTPRGLATLAIKLSVKTGELAA